MYSPVETDPSERSAAKAVEQFLAAGVPAKKLVLGTAFYGRAFTGVTSQNNGLRQPFATYVDEYSWSTLSHDFIDQQGFKRYWDATAKAPYLWNAATHTFITYDDPQSIKAKVEFVKQHNLGGLMYWEQSQDPGEQLLDSMITALRTGSGK